MINNEPQARISDYHSLMPPLSSESKVLDIGLNDGYVSKFLKKQYDCECWGIDIKRPESFERVKEFKRYNINFVFDDIAHNRYLPFPQNYFDLVIFTEVLEHLIVSHPPYSLFKEINRILKNSTGYLVLSTPNIAELIKRLKLLIGKHPVPRPHEESEFYKGHYREYTLEELYYLLNESGFEIVQSRMRNYSTFAKRYSRLRKIYSLPLTIIPSFRTSIQISAKKKVY